MPHAARQNIIVSHGGTHGPAGRTYRQGGAIPQKDVALIPNNLMGSDTSPTPEQPKEAARAAQAKAAEARQRAKAAAGAKTKPTSSAPPPPPTETVVETVIEEAVDDTLPES